MKPYEHIITIEAQMQILMDEVKKLRKEFEPTVQPKAKKLTKAQERRIWLDKKWASWEKRRLKNQ